MDIKSSKDLRKILVTIIAEVRSGKLKVDVARTVSQIAAQLTASGRMDLEVARFTASLKKNGKPSVIKLNTALVD